MAFADINWLIGVSLAISANIISNIGLNLQKLAHSHRQQAVTDYEHKLKRLPKKERPNLQPPKQGSYVLDKMWMAGLLGQIIGALFDFAALGFAPQSVVAPLGSLTLVINVFLAPILHNEHPSKKTLLATFTIILGSAITVFFSARGDSIETVQQVFDTYEKPDFFYYAIPVVSTMVVLWIICWYMKYLSRHHKRRYRKKYRKLHRGALASLAGTMGAQNVLFAKSFSTLVILSIAGKGDFMFICWETYCITLALGFSVYYQLKWLNSGLKRFSALYIVPIFQSFWITVSVIGGLVVYREYADMQHWTNKVFFPVGVFVTIFGVFYLTTQGQPEKLKKHKNRNRASYAASRSGSYSSQSSTQSFSQPPAAAPRDEGDTTTAHTGTDTGTDARRKTTATDALFESPDKAQTPPHTSVTNVAQRLTPSKSVAPATEENPSNAVSYALHGQKENEAVVYSMPSHIIQESVVAQDTSAAIIVPLSKANADAFAKHRAISASFGHSKSMLGGGGTGSGAGDGDTHLPESKSEVLALHKSYQAHENEHQRLLLHNHNHNHAQQIAVLSNNAKQQRSLNTRRKSPFSSSILPSPRKMWHHLTEFGESSLKGGIVGGASLGRFILNPEIMETSEKYMRAGFGSFIASPTVLSPNFENEINRNQHSINSINHGIDYEEQVMDNGNSNGGGGRRYSNEEQKRWNDDNASRSEAQLKAKNNSYTQPQPQPPPRLRRHSSDNVRTMPMPMPANGGGGGGSLHYSQDTNVGARARSSSPPFRRDELAPHEQVWEYSKDFVVSLFTLDVKSSHKLGHNRNDSNSGSKSKSGSIDIDLDKDLTHASSHRNRHCDVDVDVRANVNVNGHGQPDDRDYRAMSDHEHRRNPSAVQNESDGNNTNDNGDSNHNVIHNILSTSLANDGPNDISLHSDLMNDSLSVSMLRSDIHEKDLMNASSPMYPNENFKFKTPTNPNKNGSAHNRPHSTIVIQTANAYNNKNSPLLSSDSKANYHT